MFQTNNPISIFVAYILGQVELKEDKRKAGLQSVGNKWRQFKFALNRDYVKPHVETNNYLALKKHPFGSNSRIGLESLC